MTEVDVNGPFGKKLKFGDLVPIANSNDLAGTELQKLRAFSEGDDLRVRGCEWIGDEGPSLAVLLSYGRDSQGK
jgi:hypothetical protein